jgi:hypothetical protein
LLDIRRPVSSGQSLKRSPLYRRLVALPGLEAPHPGRHVGVLIEEDLSPRFELAQADGDGTKYTFDFDAANNCAVGQNRSTIYEAVQPGVAKPGMAVFSVAPEAQDFTLTITDLANPQAGQSANVEL